MCYEKAEEGGRGEEGAASGCLVVKEVTLKDKLEGQDLAGEGIPGSRHSMCKGPVVGVTWSV